MTDKKEMKVVFAPGCFDNFEGTQEELNELMAEIHNMFEGKTADELKAQSRQLDADDFEDMPEELQEILMRQLAEVESTEDRKRKLQ